MRWPMAVPTTLAVLLLLAPGCLSPPTATTDEAPATEEQLQSILIRGYLDNEHVFHVRFAAVSQYQEIVPFDGFVWVTLEPGEVEGEEKSDWIPRFWSADVWKGGFSKDTPLPYWEFTTDATWLDYGDPVRMVARAELPDGSQIQGTRESFA